MHFSEINAFFHMASQGDTEAFEQLYNLFTRRAKFIIRTTIETSSNFSGIPDDFSDLIDKIFFGAINDYEAERGPFHVYCDYMISKRLSNIVKQKVYDDQTFRADIEYSDDDLIIDRIADPDSSNLLNDIVVDDFRLSISSPNKYKTRDRRLRDKVLVLQLAGYSSKEICETLKITYSAYRWLMDKLKEDSELINLKLDLK